MEGASVVRWTEVGEAELGSLAWRGVTSHQPPRNTAMTSIPLPKYIKSE